MLDPRYARIIAALTARIPDPWRPPPKPRATYLKLRPGDRLEVTTPSTRGIVGDIWQVSTCDSEGMWLTPAQVGGGTVLAVSGWRWTGPWGTNFRKLPRLKAPKKPQNLVDNPTAIP